MDLNLLAMLSARWCQAPHLRSFKPSCSQARNAPSLTSSARRKTSVRVGVFDNPILWQNPHPKVSFLEADRKDRHQKRTSPSADLAPPPNHRRRRSSPYLAGKNNLADPTLNPTDGAEQSRSSSVTTQILHESIVFVECEAAPPQFNPSRRHHHSSSSAPARPQPSRPSLTPSPVRNPRRGEGTWYRTSPNAKTTHITISARRPVTTVTPMSRFRSSRQNKKQKVPKSQLARETTKMAMPSPRRPGIWGKLNFLSRWPCALLPPPPVAAVNPNRTRPPGLGDGLVW